MAEYKVREHFVVHLENLRYPEGQIIELTPEEYKQVAHQVEAVPTNPKTKVKQNGTPDNSST